MDKMSSYNTISWLQAIERDYIHGGDESFDNKRKQAIQTAIQSIEKLEKIEQIINRSNGFYLYHDLPPFQQIKKILEQE